MTIARYGQTRIFGKTRIFNISVCTKQRMLAARKIQHKLNLHSIGEFSSTDMRPNSEKEPRWRATNSILRADAIFTQ